MPTLQTGSDCRHIILFSGYIPIDERSTKLGPRGWLATHPHDNQS